MKYCSGTLVCMFLMMAATAFAGEEKAKKACCSKANAQQATQAKTKADPKVKTDATAKATKTDKKTTVAGGAGMVVTIGDRGPDGDAELSPEMREALEQMVNTSSEGLRQQTLADGTVIVDLEGRFQSAMVVTVGKDGKMQGSCYSTVPGHKCSAKHVKAKAKAKAEPKKKDQ